MLIFLTRGLDEAQLAHFLLIGANIVSICVNLYSISNHCDAIWVVRRL